MTEYEAYQEHIRYTHDTYCRIVIRHASFDAARMLAARWRREISLEYLTEEKFVPLSTTDEYFQVPDYGETYLFSVRGQTIFLDSCSLAAALAGLPEQTQEEIFLYYFQHLTQKEIGEQSGWTRSTIGRHIQLALKQLKEEITRISDVTEFNGQKLLNGEYDLKGYTNKQEVKVNYYSTDVPVKEYTIKSIPLTKDADGNIVLDGDVTFGDGFPDAKTLKTELKDDLLTITGENGFEMRLDVSGTLNGAQTGTTVKDLKINATGIGAMRLQIGANEHQVLEVNIPAVSLQNMGIENVDVSTAEGADDAIDRVDGAIKYVSSVRGRLGAFQNRLESTINSLDITSENMTSAYSRIMDVDMAEEMTSYTTYQILAQAGTSMLAQANERPSQVLQLLQ